VVGASLIWEKGAQLAGEDACEDARAATCCHAAWFRPRVQHIPIRSSSFAIRSLTNLPTNSMRRAHEVHGNNFIDTHDIR
jgi:hypothetical protein